MRLAVPGVLLLGVTSLALAAGRAPAQELTGVALGPEGEPLPGTAVVLHRVGGGGGAFVATDTTDARGEFRFTVQGPEGSIHFAALRHDGRMYIGPAIEAGAEPVTDYVLRVEPGSEAGAVASALSGQGRVAPPGRPAVGTAASRTDSDMGAFLLVTFLALATVAAFMIAAPRYRRRRTREALIELARAENALEAPPGPEDRARLAATRDRLRKQLAPGS